MLYHAYFSHFKSHIEKKIHSMTTLYFQKFASVFINERVKRSLEHNTFVIIVFLNFTWVWSGIVGVDKVQPHSYHFCRGG